MGWLSGLLSGAGTAGAAGGSALGGATGAAATGAGAAGASSLGSTIGQAAIGSALGGNGAKSGGGITDMLSQSWNQGQVFNPQNAGPQGLAAWQRGLNFANQADKFGSNIEGNANQYAKSQIYNWLKG